MGVKQKQFLHSSVFFLLLALVFTVSMGYGIVLLVLRGFLGDSSPLPRAC